MTIVTATANDERTESVLRTAHDLATAHDERLIVLHVVSKGEIVERQQGIHSLNDVPQEPIDREIERSKREVDTMLKDTLGTADAIDAAVRVGSPADEIISVGEEVDAHYLVIGGQRRSPTGKALFGSVTQSVLLQADRPVVTVMGGEADTSR